MFGKKKPDTTPIPEQSGGTTRYRAAGGDGVTTYPTAAKAKEVGDRIAAYRNAGQQARGK